MEMYKLADVYYEKQERPFENTIDEKRYRMLKYIKHNMR